MLVTGITKSFAPVIFKDLNLDKNMVVSLETL